MVVFDLYDLYVLLSLREESMNKLTAIANLPVSQTASLHALRRFEGESYRPRAFIGVGGVEQDNKNEDKG